MANFVIKKDGAKEAFDSEKIKNSIRMAATGTDLTKDRMNEVVEQVTVAATRAADEKEEIATSEIKAKVLSELDTVEPSIADAWRQYEQAKGST